MWLDLVIDVFMPTGREKPMEQRVAAATDARTLGVDLWTPGSFKSRLNASGWLADEVVAAGALRQGKPPSMISMVTGAALVEVVRPRRTKSLPREIALAVTTDRVVAFAMSAWSEGDEFTDYVVKIKRGEVGSWPLGSARLSDRADAAGWKGGTLQLGDLDPFPVTWNSDPSSDELVELISR